MKERSHIPKEVIGNTEQLLEDVKDWPHEPVCWSAKAKEYQIIIITPLGGSKGGVSIPFELTLRILLLFALH